MRIAAQQLHSTPRVLLPSIQQPPMPPLLHPLRESHHLRRQQRLAFFFFQKLLPALEHRPQQETSLPPLYAQFGFDIAPPKPQGSGGDAANVVTHPCLQTKALPTLHR
mmetsp:Transcript_15503/g.25870  ORF Transcript_15503/g.25870 Transcript_15503/m.25870 type:complete len:108 (+) Transcript_15503:1215-1538(+)